MKKELVLAAAVVAALGTAPMALVAADTYTEPGGWDDDGKTVVSTTITSTYEVEIPATLTLPQTDEFTSEANNVTVKAGAQISAADQILVELTGETSEGAEDEQVFTAAYQGGATDDVDYLVKLNNETPIADTSDKTANRVIQVDAETAHDEGATGTINVGFNTEPEFKYSGVYKQNVAFTVSVEEVRDETPV